MEYEYGYHAFHFLHFFIGIFLVLFGVFIGKALAWRRMMMRFGPGWGQGPGAYGGCCGARRCCGQAPAQAASNAPPASEAEPPKSA